MKSFIFFLFFAQAIYSQQLISDDSIKLNAGFYRDFYELKYNKPSILIDFKLDTVVVNYGGILVAPGSHVYYYITISRNKKELTNGFYGFCDGINIYKSYAPNLLKFDFIGRYCISIIPVKGVDDRVLDLNTGIYSALTKAYVENAIDDDKELLNRFKLDQHRVLSKYLIEYSVKHKNQIQINKQDVTSGYIIDILQKLPTDSTYEIYYKRSMDQLKTIRDIIKVEIWQSKYNNGNYKFIGLSAFHKFGGNPNYTYKIGLWRYFYRNGELKEEIMFDLKENKIFDKHYELTKE